MGICSSKSVKSEPVGTSSRTGKVKKQPTVEKTKKSASKPKEQDVSDQTGVDNSMQQTTLTEELQNTRGLPIEQSSDAGSQNQKAIKVLLLGAGESGKSTILQQLKILHQNGFSKQELIDYTPLIYDNIIEIGKDIISARRKFNVELEDDSLTEEDLDKIANYTSTRKNTDDINEPLDGDHHNDKTANELGNTTSIVSKDEFPKEFYPILSKLWKLKSTQNLIVSEKSSQVYLMDSTRYFLENLDRICNTPNYIPTEQDVLRSRQKTSGIFDTVVNMGNNFQMHIFDVGGQRSERKKWIHCFDNVTLVIFCVSLSEYDQFLMEDKSQNRFQESLVLFDNIVNSRWFARTSVVLFLNKIDLFAEKIQRVPLENYFPDYMGGKDINKAAKYILWRFVQLNRANLNIYPHVTQATDTSNIKLVFAAIKETILENILKDSGVLQ
ncbi:guanine nucleotide-binding protein subunit alpha [Nakaseomyces bracarensis]|uniref:guanine nucleotide-binding protein subunit alpha n=1 Tax=Nakaseomyces bracarensis TaxID=273131 RepID=UPI003871BC09